jgi:hypothetical protein
LDSGCCRRGYEAQTIEVVRACAACLAPLPPKQRVYCAGGVCKQLVRLYRLKASLAAVKR